MSLLNARDNNAIAELIQRISALESRTRSLPAQSRIYIPSQDSVVAQVNQTAHGLSVNDVVALNGSGTWIKATCDGRIGRGGSGSTYNTGPVGMVIQVLDANAFVMQMMGILDHSGFSATYDRAWLSWSTAGGVSTTTESLWQIYRGKVLSITPWKPSPVMASDRADTGDTITTTWAWPGFAHRFTIDAEYIQTISDAYSATQSDHCSLRTRLVITASAVSSTLYDASHRSVLAGPHAYMRTNGSYLDNTTSVSGLWAYDNGTTYSIATDGTKSTMSNVAVSAPTGTPGAITLGGGTFKISITTSGVSLEVSSLPDGSTSILNGVMNYD